MDHHLPYAANCTLLFRELPLLERAQAAKQAGFDAIEFWWPWPDQPAPADSDVDAFIGSVRDAGVQLIGLNFFAGELTGPDCGVLSIPARSQEFLDNVDVAVGIGQALGVRAFNALFGNRVDGVAAEAQDELGIENLTSAATAAARIGATVLLEPVSGPKPYPLRTAADVIAILDRVDSGSTGFLCDLFHLANNASQTHPAGWVDDLDAAITAYADRITHVQIADLPGRGEPGSGTLDLNRYLSQIEASGYTGFVALEYNPTTNTTLESLEWLPAERRGTSGEVRRSL